MKRLFFVLLFALTALFFSGCSSSSGGGGDNPPAPISGNVIIPSDYSSYAVYVCSDADSSNSCSDAEAYVKANPDGSFTITASANYPLVAEFYDTDPIPASGASVSSLRGINPKVVYTTPAGKTTVSAFTTMVKNKADLDPSTTVDIAADTVKIASGITDPFDAASYTGNAADTHDVVTELVEGVLSYITASLGQTVDASPAIVAALYNIIFQLLVDEGIADDPAGVDVGDLVSGAEGDVAQAIDDAETALDDAASSGNWNLISPSTLYEILYDDEKLNGSRYLMGVVQTGSPWKIWEDSGESVAVLKAENRLFAPQGDPDSTFDTSDRNNIISSTVTSPGNVFSSDFFDNQQITLSEGAKVYTFIVLNNYMIDKYPNNIGGLLNGNVDVPNLGCAGAELSQPVNFNGIEIDAPYNTITLETGNTFRWINAGYPDCVVFNEHQSFAQNGAYEKYGSGYDEYYIFTASNGSKAVLYHKNSAPEWYLAAYPKVYTKNVLFNDIAAENVRDQLNLSFTP
jgi:hypothetical protein